MFDIVQIAGKYVFVALFTDIENKTLQTVKSKLISGDKDYDFCFLNTDYIISKEHLYCGIYNAIFNTNHKKTRTKSLNTEIIFNMSPVNNIMDSLKRFGVDTSKDKHNLVCIKVVDEPLDWQSLNDHLKVILNCHSQVSITDDVLFLFIVLQKVKKVYKLNDAKLDDDDENLQARLTRLAICACQIRGL